MKVFLLVLVSILPVAVLMVLMYLLDKYQREPFKSLVKAFLGGAIGAFFITILFCILTFNVDFDNIPRWVDNFICTGLVEELSKFTIFMLFIWRDKHFDEYFDGIVYASFISIGFACTENICYVVTEYYEWHSLSDALDLALIRALYCVPGHFLYGIILGFFLSLAKFKKKKRLLYLLTGLFIVVLFHGLWDYLIDLLIHKSVTNTFYFIVSDTLDVILWVLGVIFIRRHLTNSKNQAELAKAAEQTTTENNELTNT